MARTCQGNAQAALEVPAGRRDAVTTIVSCGARSTASMITLGRALPPSTASFNPASVTSSINALSSAVVGQQAFGVTAPVRISDNVVFNAGVGGGFQQRTRRAITRSCAILALRPSRPTTPPGSPKFSPRSGATSSIFPASQRSIRNSACCLRSSRNGRAAEQSARASPLAVLRLHGRSRFRPLPLGGLGVPPSMARHGRQGLDRPAVQAGASWPAQFSRRPCREPAEARPVASVRS